MSIPDVAQQVYDRLWAEAEAAFRQDAIQLDPYLEYPEIDRRRGLCLVARPSAATGAEFAGFVARLQALEPEQYYYKPSEFHVTVLTLINAYASFDLEAVPLDRYRTALEAVLCRQPALSIRFRGITASPAAVMIQGYAAGDALNLLRDTIREALGRAGLGDGIDVRYRITTAHSTCMRFRAPLRNPGALYDLLAGARDHEFGTSTIGGVDLMTHDWTMSEGRARRLASYPLVW